MNNTIREIAEKIMGCESILLFPHINMDGDAMGSGAALCGALRKMGKRSYVAIEDGIAENLQFLDKGFCTPVNGGEAFLPSGPPLGIHDNRFLPLFNAQPFHAGHSGGRPARGQRRMRESACKRLAPDKGKRLTRGQRRMREDA